ncbi:MAG: LPXTG cell wall anchor domain-containing protein [Ilumatobacteraceae bacterium]
MTTLTLHRAARPATRRRIVAAAALTLLPLAAVAGGATTAAAAVNLGQAEVTSACDGAGGTFLWHVTVINDTGQPHTLQVWLENTEVVNQTIADTETFEASYPAEEGGNSYAFIEIDGVEVTGAKEFPVDCLPDQAPTATIELVCPTAENPDQDIFVRMTMTVLGDAAEFQWSDTSGSAYGTQIVSNDTIEATFKTTEGDPVDAWVMAGGNTIATLVTTTHCDPPGSGSGAGTGSGGATLPQTGSSPFLPITGGTVLVAGFVLTALGRRRPA